MLALVTCHIFPPLNLIWKKNEFLAPDFPADNSQFFRVHGFMSAVRRQCATLHSLLWERPLFFLEHHGGDEDQDISDLWNDWNAEVSGTNQSLITDNIKNDDICSHPGCSPPRRSNIDQSQGLDPGKDFGSYHWEVCGKGSFIVPTIGFQRRLIWAGAGSEKMLGTDVHPPPGIGFATLVCLSWLYTECFSSCVSLTWLLLRFWAFISWRRPTILWEKRPVSLLRFFSWGLTIYRLAIPFKFGAWYMFKFLATNLGNSTNLPVIRVIHDWFPDALHTQTDRSTPPQSQQTEIDFLSLYVRKLSGKKI